MLNLSDTDHFERSLASSCSNCTRFHYAGFAKCHECGCVRPEFLKHTALITSVIGNCAYTGADTDLLLPNGRYIITFRLLYALRLRWIDSNYNISAGCPWNFLQPSDEPNLYELLVESGRTKMVVAMLLVQRRRTGKADGEDTRGMMDTVQSFDAKRNAFAAENGLADAVQRYMADETSRRSPTPPKLLALKQFVEPFMSKLQLIFHQAATQVIIERAKARQALENGSLDERRE